MKQSYISVVVYEKWFSMYFLVPYGKHISFFLVTFGKLFIFIRTVNVTQEIIVKKRFLQQNIASTKYRLHCYGEKSNERSNGLNLLILT